MLCKSCGKNHPLKGKFVEWNNGIITLALWSPCTPNNVINEQYDADKLKTLDLLNKDVFDVDSTMYVPIRSLIKV